METVHIEHYNKMLLNKTLKHHKTVKQTIYTPFWTLPQTPDYGPQFIDAH